MKIPFLQTFYNLCIHSGFVLHFSSFWNKPSSYLRTTFLSFPPTKPCPSRLGRSPKQSHVRISMQSLPAKLFPCYCSKFHLHWLMRTTGHHSSPFLDREPGRRPWCCPSHTSVPQRPTLHMNRPSRFTGTRFFIAVFQCYWGTQTAHLSTPCKNKKSQLYKLKLRLSNECVCSFSYWEMTQTFL